METTLRLVSVAVLVILNGFFVAAEFALVSARGTRLEQMALAGSRQARLASSMQGDLDRYLAACQLGITLASLALGAVAEPTIGGLIEPLLEHVLDSTPIRAISGTLGVILAFMIVTTLHIVLGEQAPKVFAIRSPEQVSKLAAYPLELFNKIFAIFILFLDWLTARTLRLFGVNDPPGHHSSPTLEDIRMMLNTSTSHDASEKDAREMIINVFDFAERGAYQVMVPRPQVSTIRDTATTSEFLELFAQTGHTRFPVVGERGVDDVRGVISAKDVLIHLRDAPSDRATTVSALMRPAFFVPETKRIGKLLNEMRRKHTRMAILVDEYGGMAGIATMENMVEEVMGELQDELDRDVDDVRPINDTTFVVDAQMRIDEFNTELHASLPEGDYETVAGFLLQQWGYLPQPGDSFVFNDLRFVVTQMIGPRIEQLEVRKL
ncbi:MAG: HlyC/CorC family transporter [Herpetosiphonaceae bacterium]|nr:HlyC/CorC family transporter [Herpetosiphonaceae bacterium]